MIDDVPTMYLGGFSTTFRNRLYRAHLAPGQPLDSGRWVFDTDTRGRVRPLVQDPPHNGWDRAGMHTPSFVPGTDDHPPHLYYTGRASLQHYGNRSSYTIGVLEYHQGRWKRRAEPVLRGSAPPRSVLEPLVIHDRGRYLMWFQANPNEIGPGELPDDELRITESTDGISWSPPKVFAHPEEGFFDHTVHRVGQRWVMVLARGANLHPTPRFPGQGLWSVTATEHLPDRSGWTAPVRLLDTDRTDTPEWMTRGVYGPAPHTQEGTEEAVPMYTAVRAAPSGPRSTCTAYSGAGAPSCPPPSTWRWGSRG